MYFWYRSVGEAICSVCQSIELAQRRVLLCDPCSYQPPKIKEPMHAPALLLNIFNGL